MPDAQPTSTADRATSAQHRARIVIAALGVCILIGVWQYIPGLLGAAALYVLSGRAYEALRVRMGARWAAGLVILLVLLLVMLPLVALFAAMAGRAPQIVDQMLSGDTFERLSAVRLGRVHIGEVLQNIGGQLQEWFPSQALGLLGGLVQTTINLVIAMFGLYYLLLAGGRTWENVKDFLPLSEKNADLLRTRFRSVTEAMLLGIIVTAIVQGGLVGFAFFLVGFEDVFFWAGITAIVSVLPVFGSGLVWFPGVVVLAIDGRMQAALLLTVIGAGIASNIDNLIRPIVYWKVSSLHPLTTIVGAFAGIAVFGLAGLIIGPLVLSYFFELLRVYRAEFGPETLPDTRAGSSATAASPGA